MTKALQMTATRFKSMLLFIAAFALISCGGGGTDIVTSSAAYTAVVDAGSSGSRIYLYQTTPDSSFVKVQQLYTNKDAPHPLSWYDGSHGLESASTQAGPTGIEPLLAGLKDYLVKHDIALNEVSVNVLATAGMRQVSIETSRAIYGSVKNTITNNGLRYGQVRTLSGQYESLYSWADVNFLQGNFHSRTATQGIVEVGGASSQVAFVTAPSSAPQVLTAQVNGVSYPVFSISYLGLGQNQARLAMINDLLSGGTQANVCYPNNTSGTPRTYDAAVGSLTINAVSSSYTAACYGVYEKVIGDVSVNVDNTFAISQVSQQAGYASTQFLGVSAVYFAHKEWGAIESTNTAQALKDALDTNCIGSSAWTKVLTQYNNDAGVFAQNGCANSTYIHAYLYSNQALGINPARITPVASIKGIDLTWTRGFVVLDGR